MKPKPSNLGQWLVPLLLIPLLAVLAYGLMLVMITPQDELTTVVVGDGVRTVAETAVPTTTPTVTSIPATATPPPVGYSRSNPYPQGSVITLQQWEVAVVGSIIRGDEAWQLLQAANFLNEPPPDGSEYLLVQFRVAHTGQTDEEQSISLHVTGSQNVLYYSFNNGQVPPDPILDTNLPAPAKSEGWKAYTIAAGEGNLVLMVEDLRNYDEPPQYVALTDDPAPDIPYDKLSDIQPSSVGNAPDNAAAVGQTAVNLSWQITVQEMIGGDAAWQRLLETNRFNDPPPPGMEYVLCRVRVRYVGLEEGPEMISRYSHFWVQDGQGEKVERPSLVVPEPEMFVELFPGGEFIGWLAFQVAINDPSPLLVFDPDTFLSENGARRYFIVRMKGE